MYIGLHVKYSYPLFLSDFNATLIFFYRFSKNTLSIQVRPMGVELLHTDGRTDGPTDKTTLIVVFRNFEKACKTVRCLGKLRSPFI